jgi:hypothetical protein
MKRQIRNAVTSLVITAFAGVGLMAFGQDAQPTCPAPQPIVIEKTVEIQKTVEQQQPCPQPTVIQTVQDFVVQQPQQPQQPQVGPTTGCVGCEDLCDLVKDVEDSADDLRKYFRRSLRCLECADEAYYDSVKEFERATDRLKRNYRRDCDSCDVAGDVQEVIALANCISAYMDPCSLCPEATEAWAELQADLQQLGTQFCTVASFQQPVSLACPVPVCAQPACPAPVAAPACPAPVVAPVCPAPVVAPVCPAPVVAPTVPAPGPVIYK